MGAWLAAGVLADAYAVRNFRAADRFLSAPALQDVESIHALGRENTRVLLRRFAEKQNRWSYEEWEWAQLGIGLALLLILVFGSRPPVPAILLCLTMLVIVLTQRMGLTAWSGGFSGPADPRPGVTFPRQVYSVLEFAKLALGLGVAAILVLRKPADPDMFVRQSEKEEAVRRRT